MVVAVLSRNYIQSCYGRMEWQAALRTDNRLPSFYRLAQYNTIPGGALTL
jgi:hypothetical protein